MSAGDEKDPLTAPGPDETLDAIGRSGLRILQPKTGFRFALDPVILADFVTLRPYEKVVDLGTGSGIIPLLLAQRQPTAKISGIEIDGDTAERARRSVRLNSLEDRISICHRDLRSLEKCEAQRYDLVVTNPPYRPPERGRIAAPSRAAARHELHGTLDDFIRAGRHLLKSGGRFYAVFPAERLAELLTLMTSAGLAPKRLRSVHSRAGDPARLVLVEGRRDGGDGMQIAAPLILYEDRHYSAEVRRIFGEVQSADTLQE